MSQLTKDIQSALASASQTLAEANTASGTGEVDVYVERVLCAWKGAVDVRRMIARLSESLAGEIVGGQS